MYLPIFDGLWGKQHLLGTLGAWRPSMVAVGFSPPHLYRSSIGSLARFGYNNTFNSATKSKEVAMKPARIVDQATDRRSRGPALRSIPFSNTFALGRREITLLRRFSFFGAGAGLHGLHSRSRSRSKCGVRTDHGENPQRQSARNRGETTGQPKEVGITAFPASSRQPVNVEMFRIMSDNNFRDRYLIRRGPAVLTVIRIARARRRRMAHGVPGPAERDGARSLQIRPPECYRHLTHARVLQRCPSASLFGLDLLDAVRNLPCISRSRPNVVAVLARLIHS